MTQRNDPAERGYLRFYYRNWRPTRFGQIWSRVWAWASGLGLTPSVLLSLQVPARSDGRLCPVVLAAVRYRGHRYVVSMLGNGSEWVKNVRAAGGRVGIKRGRTRPVLLTELPPAERAPILKAWCKIAPSGRQHLTVPHEAPLATFDSIARDYPVFRIDPVR